MARKPPKNVLKLKADAERRIKEKEAKSGRTGAVPFYHEKATLFDRFRLWGRRSTDR